MGTCIVTTLAVFVIQETFIEIIGCSGIKTIVRAEEDIDVPHRDLFSIPNCLKSINILDKEVKLCKNSVDSAIFIKLMNNVVTDKTMGAFEARRNFGSVLRDVEAKGKVVVVERHGEEVAAVVPMHLYRQWKQSREAFFAKLRLGAAQSNVSEEEASALADKAIKAVRAQQS